MRVESGAQGLTVVMFTDLVGSTALLSHLGDDRMQELQSAHIGEVARTVAGHGGVVHKTMGDGVMASFPSALRALAAGAEVAREVEALDAREGAPGLAVRVGVSAGEPIVDGQDLQGMTVVIAARLCAAAPPGEVLVQDVVCALVASRNGFAFAPASAYELKGVPAAVPAAVLDWRACVAEPSHVPEAPEIAGVVGLPRTLAGFADEPFVGREREAALLRDALLPAGPGRRAALVRGEPGIGKTRIAASLAHEAHAAGCLVVLARCPPESVTPYEPWVRGLGELAAAGDDRWRTRLAAAAGAELCALVPELQTAEGGPAVPGAAEGAMYRVLRGIANALTAALPDGQRLLLILDDAHWADEGSVHALRAVLDSPVADRLSLLVTARDRELGRRHPVAAALHELRRTRELTEMTLEGLDASGVAALVAARLGRAVTPRVVARLLTRTGGNPFFSAELAHELEGRGALREDALDTAPVPEAVAGLVEERLRRLGPETEDFLVVAAAIGPRPDVALAGAAAGITEAEQRAAVAEAVAERLIDEELAPTPRIAFAHALVREALLGLRTAAERARLHHAIAEQLSARGDAEPSELARHRELAAPLTGSDPAVTAHRSAAESAAAAGAHDRAGDHLEAALRLAAPAEDRGPLLLALGDQRLLAADLRRGRIAYLAAAQAARAAGDATTLARAALGHSGGDIGFVVEMPQEDPTGPALLREALDRLGDEEPVLALGLALRRVFAVAFSDDVAELTSLRTGAKRHAALADTEEAKALACLVQVVSLSGRAEDALAHVASFRSLAGQAVEHAARSGRDDLLLRAQQVASYGAYAETDLPAAEALLAEMATVTARLDAPRYTFELSYLLAGRHMDRCEFEAGAELIRATGAALRDVRSELQFAVESLLAYIEFFRAGDAGSLLQRGQRDGRRVRQRGLARSARLVAGAGG